MSVSKTHPQWFTNLAAREQEIVLRSEADAIKTRKTGSDSFTLQVSVPEYEFWGKVMTAVSEAGWEFFILTPAGKDGQAFAIFKKAAS